MKKTDYTIRKAPEREYYLVDRRTEKVTPVKIRNAIRRKNDYKVNLVDKNTGRLFLKENGEPRSWMLMQSIELGVIEAVLSGEKRVCPFCQERFLIGGKELCHGCEVKKKKRFFEDNVEMCEKPLILDDEQAEALLGDGHALVTARAGSGKTRVLVAKLIDLLFVHKLKEDEVIAFCFNRDAANEIHRRLNAECMVRGQEKSQNIDVVRTFHSFAKSLLGDQCGPILVDDAAPVRTKFIKRIINDLRETSPRFEQELRKYFLRSILSVDRREFASAEQYYLFVRNSYYYTLNGERVRSVAEKIIADFLFEHGIKYKYERRFFLSNVDTENHQLTPYEWSAYKKGLGQKRETVPDFYLEDYDIVWEHWGVTGKETKSKKKSFTNAVGDYDSYVETMGWKRNFWNSWRFKLNTLYDGSKDFSTVNKLIETNPEFFSTGKRDEIELALKTLLEANGVVCERLPEDYIIAEAWKNAEDHFTKQIVQFVDKFQQKYMSNEAAFESLARTVTDDCEKTFLRLGYMVYKKYVWLLGGQAEGFEGFEEYHLDFNQCLREAARKIRAGEYDCKIKALKWVLIDEYQDFSQLFYDLIHAIRLRNPSARFFCVGDDWQAINRFAGSDLKFFRDFREYFPDANHYQINTNYRSEKHLVDRAGAFMKRYEMPGSPQQGRRARTGVFLEEPVKYRDDFEDFAWLISEDGPWCAWPYPRMVQAYIKRCSEIINDNPGKKILVLNRKNKFLGKGLEEIKRILSHPKLCKISEPNIDVKTIHSSKGEEADVVIITEADDKNFPLLHIESKLFRIFGESLYEAFEDEIRLYYVALTRAKQSVYILYSGSSPSRFLSCAAPMPTRQYVKNKRIR